MFKQKLNKLRAKVEDRRCFNNEGIPHEEEVRISQYYDLMYQPLDRAERKLRRGPMGSAVFWWPKSNGEIRKK